MWKYLKAAFWARPRIAGLGDVPLIALAAGAFTILGFIHPAIWLLGFGTLGGLAFGLASSQRFRTVIDAHELATRSGRSNEAAREQLPFMDAESRQQFAELRSKCDSVLALFREQGADKAELRTTGEALEKLQAISTRLLIQRQRLLGAMTKSDVRRISSDIDLLERELRSEKLSDSVRTSQTATLELLRKRLDVAEQRTVAINEITSDLQRIRTQVELALDEASLRGKPVAVSTNIELASQMLDARLFGNGTSSIDLDTDFARARN
jgi:hypothetical protein